VSHGTRALPALATLVGALGLAGEDLSHHGTCALAAMARSATRPMALGDERMEREPATQVTVTQERGCAVQLAIGMDTTRQPDENALGKGRTDEQPRLATQSGCHAVERRRERGRMARPMTEEGNSVATRQARAVEGGRRMSSHTALGLSE
jgi:hypothetical protein